MRTAVPRKMIYEVTGHACVATVLVRYADLSFHIASGLLTWIQYVAGDIFIFRLNAFSFGNHACGSRQLSLTRL